MDLKELVKQMKVKKLAADEDPGTDPRTYTIKTGKIRRAREDLKELFNTYRGEISRRVVFILTTGPGAKAFHDLATSDEFGCFSADADGVYKDIVKNINPRLYQDHPFSPDVLNTVSNYFQDVADDLGILGYPMIVYKNKYARTNKNKEEFLASVKMAINEDVGSEIVGYHILKSVAEQAFAESFNGKIVPVVIHTDDVNLVEELNTSLRKISRNVFVVETAQEVSVEKVEKELKTIRKQMKNVV